MYEDLEEELESLMQMREVWERRLQHLKANHKILVKMQAVQHEQCQNTIPIFSHSQDNTTQSNQNENAETQVVEKEVTEEIDEDGYGYEEEEEEDEEEARRALSMMLEQFGDNLFNQGEDK